MALMLLLRFDMLIMERSKGTQTTDACFYFIAYLNIHNCIYLNIVLCYLLSGTSQCMCWHSSLVINISLGTYYKQDIYLACCNGKTGFNFKSGLVSILSCNNLSKGLSVTNLYFSPL